MQKLWNLKDWKELRVGKSIHFPVKTARMLRIDFNSPEAVHVYIKIKDDVIFLARTRGRDVVEFAVDDEFELLVEDGVTYIHVDEGDMLHYVNTTEETFVKIHEPRARNYEEEMTNYRIRQHFQARIEEMDRLFDQRIKAMEKVPENDATAATPSDDGQEIPEEGDMADDQAEND